MGRTLVFSSHPQRSHYRVTHIFLFVEGSLYSHFIAANIVLVVVKAIGCCQ